MRYLNDGTYHIQLGWTRALGHRYIIRLHSTGGRLIAQGHGFLSDGAAEIAAHVRIALIDEIEG